MNLFRAKKFVGINRRNIYLIAFILVIALACIIAQFILVFELNWTTSTTLVIIPYNQNNIALFYIFTSIVLLNDLIIIIIGALFLYRRSLNKHFLLRYFFFYGFFVFEIVIHFILPIAISANYIVPILCLALVFIFSVIAK